MDWRLLSNRLSLILPVAAGVISFGWDFFVNDNLGVLEAGRAGIAVFLAWAIAREIDPDREWVAYAAMPLSLVLSIGHSPNLVVVAVALIGLRTLVGTTGRDLSSLDHLALVIGAGLAALDPVGWPVAALVVVAIVVSSGRSGIWWASLAAVASLAVALASADVIPELQEAPIGGYLPLVFIGLAGLLARVGYVRTTTDSRRQPVSRARLRSARVASGLIVAYASFVGELVDVAVVGPILAAALPAAVAPASERR